MRNGNGNVNISLILIAEGLREAAVIGEVRFAEEIRIVSLAPTGIDLSHGRFQLGRSVLVNAVFRKHIVCQNCRICQIGKIQTGCTADINGIGVKQI